jgi:hypothetical protein
MPLQYGKGASAGRHGRRLGNGESLEIDDQAYFPIPVLSATGDGLFNLKNQITHIVVFVVGVFFSWPHVHQRPAVFVVAPHINLSGFTFFSENGRKILVLFVWFVV